MTDRVTVQNVARSFGRAEKLVHVLRDVNLAVAEGELIALYGPSGSGKTTLLNLIGALDRPTNGRITVCDTDILDMSESQRAQFRRTRLGFIFQSNVLLPTYTAQENIDIALRLGGVGFFERRRRAKAALEAVGLVAWADHMPEEMSGGQQQRVTIARALALQPNVILADEPTSGLDTRTARRMLSIFRMTAEARGTTFLIVSHDPLVVDYVDSVYDLTDGRLSARPQATFGARKHEHKMG